MRQNQAFFAEQNPDLLTSFTVHAYLTLGVAEDDGLGDGERVVEVTQRVKLPLLALHRHEELLDSLQRQLVTFHQNPAHKNDN